MYVLKIGYHVENALSFAQVVNLDNMNVEVDISS